MEFQQELRQIIRSTPGNEICVDCQEPNPTWASVNLGVFMCLACSGVHRAMGVHISFVKSTTLDKWTPQLVANMRNGGNKRANAFFEANLPSNYPRPKTMKDREVFIRSKYQDRKWIRTNDTPIQQESDSSTASESKAQNTHESSGRKKRIPPSQRRLMQQQQQQTQQSNERSSDVLLDTDFTAEPSAKTQGASASTTMGSMFQNMSIKVASEKPAPPAPPSPAQDLLLGDFTSGQEETVTTTDSILSNFGFSQTSSDTSLPPTIQDQPTLHNSILETFGNVDNVAHPDATSSAFDFLQPSLPVTEGSDMSSTGVTGMSNGNAHKMAALDSLSGLGGGVHSSSSTPSDLRPEEELGQITAELQQIQDELEQAKYNLHVFLEAKQTLLQSKNRLEQLSGFIDSIQMTRLDSLQGLSPEMLGQRKNLNTHASSLAAQVQAIHNSMSSNLS